MSEEVLKPLSRKHKAFCENYLKWFNGTRAYMAVYKNCTYEAARANASDLLAKSNIKAYIDDRLTAMQMGTDEALKLMSDIARGDIGDLVDNNGLLDLREARSKGMTKLIKKIKQKTITRIGKKEDDEDVEITEIEFEMYSAKDAQETILKVNGKLKDPDITINVKLTDD